MTILEACSTTLSVLAEDGIGMVVCNVSEVVRAYRPRQQRAHVAVLHTFLSLSIDATMVYLFKLIELSVKLLV